MIKNIDFPTHLHSLSNQLRATVHEDNTSALSLATEQRISGRMFEGLLNLVAALFCPRHIIILSPGTGQTKKDVNYM